MTNFHILSLADSEKWNHYLKQLPIDHQDVYFTPEYYSLYEANGDGKALCFIFEHDGDLALYPFLLNKINELGYDLNTDYFDVQGAYGYNGMATSTNSADFLKSFSDFWLTWAQDNNIVAEFIRYNPVLRNENLCPWAPPIDVLDNVLIPLTNYEDIWAHSYDRGVRQAIRKASRHNLSFHIQIGNEITQDTYDNFLELYKETMDRQNADSFYYFDQEFFHRLKTYLKEYLLIMYVEYQGHIISIDLVLHNNINVYGFLSGTKRKYFHVSPNSYLRDETIKALIDKGFKNYSIGGGLSRNDSIFKYKKSFSKNTESLFYIGKKIHNDDVYNAIVYQWQQKLGNASDQYKHLLLKYRYGL